VILALYCIPTDKATFYAGYPPPGRAFSRLNGLPKKIVLRTKCVAIQIEFVRLMNIELMYNQDMDEHKEKDTEINGALRSQGTSMLISKPLRLIEVEED